MNETKQKKQDRKLGDEWEDWTGDLDEGQEYEEGSGLFIFFATLIFAVAFLFSWFVLWLIEPRLELIHPVLIPIGRWGLRFIALVFFLLEGIIVVSVITGKLYLVRSRVGQVVGSQTLPFAIRVARRLGISRDRLANSFISFSNSVVRAGQRPVKGKVLILLPRCLQKDARGEVKEMAEKAGVLVFTATGGGQARKIIRDERPSAVIGVACERDLISGIKDVAPKLPTMGVANKRPEGPCKNTLIDMDELKKAIETFIGHTID